LTENCTLEDWREIVVRAVADAKAGGLGAARAREWLSRLLVGTDPVAMNALAEELAQVAAMVEIATDETRFPCWPAAAAGHFAGEDTTGPSAPP
jgi:hypothetical protein